MVTIAQMFIFMWRFVYRSRCGCLNSLRKEEKTELVSDEMEKLMKHSLHVVAKESEGERERGNEEQMIIF